MNKLLVNTAVFLIGLVIALFAAELLIRILNAASPLEYIPNSKYGWSLSKNTSFSHKTNSTKTEISINSLGLRDFEYTYKKPDQTYRIIALGDSFTEAFQVPLSQSFTKLAESKLQKSSSHFDKKIEVINAGVSGYGTDNELLFYQHEASKYNPDVVLLALYIGNDIRNNWYKLENIDAGGFRKPYFQINNGKLIRHENPNDKSKQFTARIKLFLNQHVRLYAFMRKQVDILRHRKTVEKGGGIPLDYFLFAEQYTNDWKSAWRVSRHLLREFNKKVAQRGARLLVVIIPSQFQVHRNLWQQQVSKNPAMQNLDWDLDKPNFLLSKILEEENIDHLDLLPFFQEKAQNLQAELYLRSDGHWNIEGHKLAGNLIGDYILKSNYFMIDKTN